MRLAIIADDLTGAMDTGVQFAKGGLHTLIMLADGDLPLAEAVVVSTDSRNEPAEIAYQRMKAIARQLRGRAVYKKIDSTLRGNIGAEIDGLFDGLGLEHALVAPAFPATGRTTVNGYHYVNGVLISETAFAKDPFWPITESYLPALLSRQTRRRVAHLPLSIVELGEKAVRETLEAEKATIVVADATEPIHLRNLAGALASLWESWIPCGSAGLAEGWPQALGLQHKIDESPGWPQALGLQHKTDESPGWPPNSDPVLVVAGSRHPSTAQQLRRAAQESGLGLVLLPEEGRWTEASLSRAASLLQRGQNVALTTTFSDYHDGQSNATAADLASATREVADKAPIAGIFITGGDIARAVCRELGAAALRALGEVQPGIPAGLLVGGHLDGVRVVTKAGGFGDELTIARSIQFLQGKTI